MDSTNLALIEGLVDPGYVRLGAEAMRRRNKLLKELLSSRALPEEPWDDVTIEYVIQQLALLDTNNFVGNVGAGEREGRVFSALVARRHFGLSHGIGRSGDVGAMQPKAAVGA